MLHGSLQTGYSAAKWIVNSILRSMYNVVIQSPARRADSSAINPELNWIESQPYY